MMNFFGYSSGMKLGSLILAPMLLIAMTMSADAVKFKKRNNTGKYPDCYCMNRGVRVELGQYACLRVDGRKFLARCEMSINNPTWRKKADICPTS